MRDVPERDDIATIRAVLMDVRDRMRYTPDPLDVELVKSPATVVRNTSPDPMTGQRVKEPMDCDDASVLASSMLGALGIPTTFVAFAADPQRPRDYSHVAVRALLKDGRWVGVDPIVRKWDVGQEVPKSAQFMRPMLVPGAMEGYGMRGLGATNASDPFSQVLDLTENAINKYIGTRYGSPAPKPKPLVSPIITNTPISTSSGFVSEWLNPLAPGGGVNFKAVAVWGVVGFAAWRLLRRRGGGRRSRR